jgi:hypothetical protein
MQRPSSTAALTAFNLQPAAYFARRILPWASCSCMKDTNPDTNMKKTLCLAIGLMAFQITPVFAQVAPPSMGHAVPATPPPNFQQRLSAIQNRPGPGIAAIDPVTGLPVGEADLPKFNLDFPGGPPGELVKQIEKATGKPLNVIIRPDDAQEDLPPLKMSSVTVPQLFAALEAATTKTENVFAPQLGRYENVKTGCGFSWSDGLVTEDTIWFFRVERPENTSAPAETKIVQYYSLAPYLDRGFTVDDITTAIQAGWKMAGVNPTPELNYHKETQMLIAYGEPSRLQTVQQVLQTLPSANAEYWKQTETQMNKMQAQIDQLKQQLANPANPPAEKSGK